MWFCCTDTPLWETAHLFSSQGALVAAPSFPLRTQSVRECLICMSCEHLFDESIWISDYELSTHYWHFLLHGRLKALYFSNSEMNWPVCVPVIHGGNMNPRTATFYNRHDSLDVISICLSKLLWSLSKESGSLWKTISIFLLNIHRCYSFSVRTGIPSLL